MSVLFSIRVSAQLKQANKFYDNLQYSKAIPLYLKALKKDDNPEAIQKLAHSYRLTKNYEQAEVYYAKAISYENADPEISLYYGEVLKNNRKLDAAKEVFIVYATKRPNDPRGEKYSLSIDKIKSWSAEEPGFEVSNLGNINSAVAEFCPYPFKDGLLFVSERHADHLHNTEFGWNERPYLSVYYAERNGGGSYKKPKLFVNAINADYHNGPICFNSEMNQAIFTRVEVVRKKDRSFINRPQLYISKLEKKKWKKAVPFEHNSNNYSLAHPSLSADGKLLFFASDMPGGYGGKDIYVCKREGDNWSKPENLGAEINTLGDELFPYLDKNMQLYFSSDGHSGYGGLDIFSAVYKDGKWGEAKNLKSPLNSPTDDFGIVFKDETNGFFSSNRPGGSGDDDLYSFILLNPIAKTTITGMFMYSKLDPAAHTTIKLLDENNVELQMTITDEKGNFHFENLQPDKNYIFLIDEADARLNNQSSLYITNDRGEIITELKKTGKGFFAFTALTPDIYNSMPILILEDESSLLTISLFGQIFDKLPGDYPAGLEVLIVSDAGEILFTATTDENGNFVFEKLPPDQTYIFRINGEDANIKLLILNEKGEMVEAIKKDAKGNFTYVRLAPDETIISLLDEKDVLIKIRPEDNFIITNIYYDYDSYDINDVAGRELDKLVLILQKNPHIGIELSSHTDSRASDKYNLELSDKRAKAAVEYIIAKEIGISKISGMGFGETQLVNHCANEVECSEEEHQKNRRTEFKIIKLN